MEKIKVLFKTEVEDYLFDLVFVLFKEDYFSFIENAELYKDNLVDFITNNIAIFPLRKTPSILIHFGSNYIFYNSNPRTTWFIFFEKQNNKFLVTHIINNHCKEAKWL